MVRDNKTWNTIKEEAKKKFKVFPSAYASYWIVNEFKKREPKKKKSAKQNSSLLTRWTNEKWVNICDNNKPCGRSKATLASATYPLCRPSKRINSSTPVTVGELTSRQIKQMCKKKRSLKQGVDGKPTRVYFPLKKPLEKKTKISTARAKSN